MSKRSWFTLSLAAVAGVIAVGALTTPRSAPAQGPTYSVWLVESSRFMKVPFGAFMPDRAFVPGSTNPMNNIPTVDLPVNVGVIKGGKDVILGAIDVASDTVESPEDVAAVIGAAMRYVPRERIIPCTNCGMAPMRRDIAVAKLNALGAGARLARERFG